MQTGKKKKNIYAIKLNNVRAFLAVISIKNNNYIMINSF